MEVDNFAHWYSFSFRTYDWSRTHPGQQELKDYLNDTVDKFGVRQHFRFGSAVERIEWDENAQWYWVHLSDGSTETFEFVVSAVGLFNKPRIPEWPGLDRFQGTKIHSARWEHQHDLTSKRVAVVGTGSTGVQMVNALAPSWDNSLCSNVSLGGCSVRASMSLRAKSAGAFHELWAIDGSGSNISTVSRQRGGEERIFGPVQPRTPRPKRRVSGT